MQKNEENDETKVASKYEEEDFGHQIEEFKSKTVRNVCVPYVEYNF